MAVTRNGQLIKMTAAADEIIGNFLVQKIRIVGVVAAGDIIQLDDAGGEMFQAKADTTLRSPDIDFLQALQFTGKLKVQTLASGVVYIYTK